MGGGRKRGRTQRNHFKENRENVWKYKDSRNTRPEGAETDQNPKSNPHWEPFISQNPGFEDYYKEQCVVPKEEWDEFMNLLRKPLPAAFRINSSGQFSQEIRQQLENDFMKSLEAEVNNERENEAIRPLPWYPDNLAWHLNFSRMELRKNQTLERFHEFLKHENEVGNITRQEAVSMVPPLFLDVLPHHHILDMCAAPGSKTFQLLEIIHQSKELGVLPDGLVIANDVDVQRCNLLIHQTKRMCSANLIVTNHEAQHFPSCSLIKSRVKISKEGQEGLGKNTLQFDRVLCDVPCSGDGTLRKAPDIWRKWNAGMGNGIHCLQVAIAMRGIALLSVGGRMVYSTCSMNPVENEAVVAEILRRSNGSVELLDVSGELPALVRRHGLKTWKVRDRGLWLASYKDVPKYRRSAILRSMFPCYDEQEDILPLDSDGGAQMDHQPTSDIECKGNDESLIANQMEEVSGEGISLKGNDENSIDEVSKFPLERCMRIVPHDQNTGAFFIAVLQKVSPLQEDARNQSSNSTRKDSAMSESLKGRHDKHPIDESSVSKNVGLENKWEKEMDACVNGEKDDEGKVGKRRRSQTQSKWKGVDPVVFFEDEATISSICSYYGISESFPLKGHLVTRNTDADHVKRIYYVSKSVHDTLQLNFQVGQRLKITSLGLKVFERQASKDSSSSKFRLSSEGLPLLLPYISKQILCASLADFRRLLRHRLIKFVDFVDTEFREKASGLMPGCCVVVLTEGKQDITDSFQVDPSTLAIVCWKGKTNMSIMVSELDGKELLERLSVRYGSDQSAVDAEPMSGDLVTDTLEDQEDGVLNEPNPEDEEVDGAEIANLETA